MAIAEPTGYITQSNDGKSLYFFDTSPQQGLQGRTLIVTNGDDMEIYNQAIADGQNSVVVSIAKDNVYKFNLQYTYDEGVQSENIYYLSRSFYKAKVLSILKNNNNCKDAIDWVNLIKGELSKDAAIVMFGVKSYKQANDLITAAGLYVGLVPQQETINNQILKISVPAGETGVFKFTYTGNRDISYYYAEFDNGDGTWTLANNVDIKRNLQTFMVVTPTDDQDVRMYNYQLVLVLI